MHPLRRITAAVAAIVIVPFVGLAGTPAQAAVPTALINGDTVVSSTDQPGKSDEQIQAEANGFAVTVVDGATWDAMTEAQFRAYDALIIGDPDCQFIAASVLANVDTWTKAVMDSGGNRFTIASDPVYHSGLASTSNRNHILKDGIGFAGAKAGATGAYVDTTCDASASNTTILNHLSVGGTGWTVEDPACAGNIGIVATLPTPQTTVDADLSDWFCSSHADYPTWAADWVPFAVSLDAPTKNYCAKDVETNATVCGEPYILVAGSGVTIKSDIALTPASSTNPVGTDHTVTATVIKDGNPQSGKTVTFTVSTGPNAGKTGSGVTDANGQTTFTYHDDGGAGTDTIVAQFTDDTNAVQQATASKTWEGVVAAHSTSTTYTGGLTVQYSDPVTLSGTLLDTAQSPSAGVPGKKLDFTLGTQSASASPTDAAGNAATTLTVTQKPGSVSAVGTSFAGDAAYLASSDSDGFAITKEDCTLAYAGDTLVASATPTTLAANLGELDAYLGDRSNKSIVFTVTGASTPTATYSATTDANGHAATTANLEPDVYDVSVAFAGDDYYKSCSAPAGTIVTVQAASAKVTGGGWISIGTGRTNFGFNAIPIAGGWKGQFQMRSNNGKNLYHAKSVTTLSGSGNTATWSGTGVWNGQSGYTFTISVVDNGSSGSKKLDTISITIKSPANVLVYSTGGAQALKGGNITVH